MQVIKFEVYTLLLLSVHIATSHIFVCNEKRTKIIEFTGDSSYCNVHTEKNSVEAILNNNQVMFIEDDFLTNIEEPCMKKQKHGFIFPGTLWCGQGTKAKSFKDLGVHAAEDTCCREHDNCPQSILAGECKGGVCNTSAYTRSHCDCDYKFQECLQKVGTSASNLIGAIFFNVVKVNCFRQGCENGNNELGSLRNWNETAEESCTYKFESIPKYRATSSKKNGRKLNFFEKFLRKVKLLR